MQRQYRAGWGTACPQDACTTPATSPLDAAFAGAAFDGPEPPIEVDDSVEPHPTADAPPEEPAAPEEAQLISYLGELPSPTDPAFDVFGTIMLPDELGVVESDEE